jgi:hypothetical protein
MGSRWVVFAIVVGLVGGTGLVLWLAWPRADENHRAFSQAELRWLREFARWEQRTSFDYCDAELLGDLPAAPTKRLTEVVEHAGDACEAAMRGNAVDALDLREKSDAALGRLLLWNSELPIRPGPEPSSHIDPRLGEIASDVAGQRVEARCWSRADWPALIAEWVATYGEPPDTELLGFAEPLARPRINLAPAICAALARFLYLDRRPGETSALLELSEAFVVLAHEAEHIRVPLASEAVVECYAIQDVRPLVTRLIGEKAYAAQMARLAWDVAYLPRSCRNGGPLDIRPRSDFWP